MKLLFKAASLLAILAIAAAAQNQTKLTSTEKKIVDDVEERAEDYVELRERVRKCLPKLSDESTQAEIASHKTAFQKGVQAARNGAKNGEIFTPAAVALIRGIIKSEFKGWERNELRKTVLEADTKGVPLKINLIYPESKELVEMSPTLLLALPQLPKQLRYRFIGRSLVILDRDNSLIVDLMREALP